MQAQVFFKTPCSMLGHLNVEVVWVPDLLSELVLLRVVCQKFYYRVLFFLKEPGRVFALVEVVLGEHIDFVPRRLT